MAVAAQRNVEDSPLKAMSAEMRAAIVRDAIGRVSEGDYRKRVFDACVEQIRNAEAVCTMAIHPGRFMRDSED